MKVTHKRTMVENRTVQGSCYLVKMGEILNDYTNVRIGWKVDQWLSIDEQTDTLVNLNSVPTRSILILQVADNVNRADAFDTFSVKSAVCHCLGSNQVFDFKTVQKVSSSSVCTDTFTKTHPFVTLMFGLVSGCDYLPFSSLEAYNVNNDVIHSKMHFSTCQVMFSNA